MILTVLLYALHYWRNHSAVKTVLANPIEVYLFTYLRISRILTSSDSHQRMCWCGGLISVMNQRLVHLNRCSKKPPPPRVSRLEEEELKRGRLRGGHGPEHCSHRLIIPPIRHPITTTARPLYASTFIRLKLRLDLDFHRSSSNHHRHKILLLHLLVFACVCDNGHICVHPFSRGGFSFFAEMESEACGHEDGSGAGLHCLSKWIWRGWSVTELAVRFTSARKFKIYATCKRVAVVGCSEEWKTRPCLPPSPARY